MSDAQITLASWSLVISLILIAYGIRNLIRANRLIRQARAQIAEAQAHLDEARQRVEEIQSRNATQRETNVQQRRERKGNHR